MNYQVILPKKVQKELKEIPKIFEIKIQLALIDLGNNPFQGKHLAGKRQEQWSFYVWPYRIIYEIDKQNLIIIAVGTGHSQVALLLPNSSPPEQ